MMGSNYYTKISDILTDGFDLMWEEWVKACASSDPETKRLVKKIISNAKANADDSFRREYKQTRTLIKTLK